jgi:hypothetical protein
LDQIKDAQVMRLIERVGEHYKTNISNRYIRPALLQLPLDKTTWDNVENLTEKFEQHRYEGFHLDEMYRQIAATARFIVATRRDVAPSLRRLSDGGASGPDKVLRDMAVNAFSANLELFANLVSELYNRVKDIDAINAKNKRPFYEQAPEFSDLDDLILNR